MKFLNQNNLESVFTRIKNHLESNYASKSFVESNLIFASDSEVDGALTDVFGSVSAIELNEDSIDLIIDETIDNKEE